MKSLDLPSFEIDSNATEPGAGFDSIGAINAESQSSVNPPVSAGVAIGMIAGFAENGLPLIEFPHVPSAPPVFARTTVPLSGNEIGREVVVVFERGDSARPIITGVLLCSTPPAQAAPVEIRMDGEQLVFSAQKEIVLRCGKSSITLTRAGKVLIRGAYLLSRSSGVNRIKGGSVQIN
jgi:hypothetical protein